MVAIQNPPSRTGLQTVADRDVEQITWEDGVCRYRIDDSDTVTEAVVVAVNSCIDRESREIPSGERTLLYERIDPDALNTLFASSGKSPWKVSFTFLGYDVTVTSDAEVLVHTDASADA